MTLDERLVRGDELMARGDPAGELIVVQCELERGGFDRRRGVELRKREVVLLAEARARLRDTPLPAKGVQFRRGAIHQLMIDIASYLRDEATIWKLAPELRHIRFHGLTYTSSHAGVSAAENDWTHARDLIARALVSKRIRGLGFLDAVVHFEPLDAPEFVTPIDGTETVDNELAQWLVETKALATLDGLELNDVHPAIWRRLATEPGAAHLDDLSLEFNGFFDETALEPLAITKLAPRRLQLRFARDVVIDRGWTASPFMRRVTDLSVPSLTDFSMGRQLRRLEVTSSSEPGWLERVASSPELGGLEELVLRHPLDLRPLHEPKQLESLRVLRLRNVPADAVRELLRSPLGRRLEAIDHWNHHESNPLRADDWDGLVVDPR